MWTTKKHNRFDEKMIFLGEDQILNEVTNRKQIIQNCLDDLERRIQTAPEGNLRISLNGNRVQYYRRLDSKNFRGKYLREKEHFLAVRLARKAFYLKLRLALKKQLKVLNDIEGRYNPFSISDLYENLSEERKRLMKPVVMSDSEYVEWWMSIEYERLGFRDNDSEHYTRDGRRVRSKSEIIIGNILLEKGIPYRYEYPITTASGIILHPDFYCLNVRRREVVIFEHFGMMDDPDYMENALKKIDLYFSLGFVLGKNLIVTFETKQKPLNTKLMEESINLYLL